MVLIMWKVGSLWDIGWKMLGKLWKTKRLDTGWLVGPTEQMTFVCAGRRFSVRIMTKEVKLDRRPGEDMNFGFMLWCWIITLPLLIMSSLSGRFGSKTDHEIVKYRYAPHNDVSVNDSPHIRRWSHNFILLYYNTYTMLQLSTVFSTTVTCCTGLWPLSDTSRLYHIA
jgi:hypothetical protein